MRCLHLAQDCKVHHFIVLTAHTIGLTKVNAKVNLKTAETKCKFYFLEHRVETTFEF